MTLALEQQVCSLELAKKLGELGVKQDSVFYWENVQKENWELSTYVRMSEVVYDNNSDDCWSILEEALYRGNAFSAFTVAELGEMLPRVIKAKGRHDSVERLYNLTPSAGGNGLCFIDYVAHENGVGTMLAAYPYIEADTEADARAAMLIYLLKNNLITPNEKKV